MNRIIFILVFSLFISACNCTNPREGGFAGGVCGLASGNYDARLKEREQELAAIKARQQTVANEQAALRQEHDEAQRTLQAIQTQVNGLEAEIKKLDAVLGNKRAATQRVKRQHSQLTKQISQMNREVTRMRQTETDGPDKKQVEQQRKRAEQLEAEVRDLWDIVNSLN